LWRGIASACLIVATVALVPAGCGSSGAKKGSSSAPSVEGSAPASLVGTYTTSLKSADLPPNPPPELTDGSNTWKLTIANSGGSVGNGRVFSIANAQLGGLESPAFDVRGDRIVLHAEECAAGGTTHFLENTYAFEVSGKMLCFTTVKNSCRDRVAETILTSEAWTKTR
jgi:hypothetical protein